MTILSGREKRHEQDCRSIIGWIVQREWAKVKAQCKPQTRDITTP